MAAVAPLPKITDPRTLSTMVRRDARAVLNASTSVRVGRALAQTVIHTQPGCPVSEMARLGRTRDMGQRLLGYFDKPGVETLLSNCGRKSSARQGETTPPPSGG